MNVNRKELSNILGITKDGLKKIEKNNLLEDRLNKIGYKYISRYKEGRTIQYEIIQENETKEVYNNMLKYVYNTKKYHEFTYYFLARTNTSILDNIVMSKKDLAINNNVSARTITNWDNTLKDKDIIANDGFFYFTMNTETNIIMEVPKEEYNSFWRNKGYIKAFKSLQRKYMNGEITLMELQLASAEVGAIIQATTNKYYYRIRKYKLHDDNKLYIDTKDIIIKLLHDRVK